MFLVCVEVAFGMDISISFIGLIKMGCPNIHITVLRPSTPAVMTSTGRRARSPARSHLPFDWSSSNALLLPPPLLQIVCFLHCSVLYS